MDSDFSSSNKDDFPVGVSWNEAIEFIKKLNLVEGKINIVCHLKSNGSMHVERGQQQDISLAMTNRNLVIVHGMVSGIYLVTLILLERRSLIH